MSDDFVDDPVGELLDRTAKGEPLTRICADNRMPGRTTVYDWLDNDEAFAERFRAARARGIHALAEECLDIADSPNATIGPDGEPQLRDVQRDRLRIDTRLRLAGKWLPSVYGDKVTQEHNVSGSVSHTHEAVGISEALGWIADALGEGEEASD